MPTAASPPAAPPPDDGSAGRRVHIRGIKEMPTGYDAEIGTIFCEMRRASQLTKEQIAERFGTTLSALDALETGALLALPDWPETSRVVMAYTEALGLDGQPILRRMATQISPDAIAREPETPERPAPPPARAPTAPPEPDPYEHFDPAVAEPPVSVATADEEPGIEAPPPKRPIYGRVARGGLLLLAMGAAFYGAWFAANRPELVSSTLDRLPEPIPRMARSAWQLLGPLGDTMRRDPRSRKSDKLPIVGEQSANK